MGFFAFVLFFFSSRRRHTRCLSDWSSDVCSSDLARAGRGEHDHPDRRAHRRGAAGRARGARSEERRVGKECRSRGAPYHEKNKENNITEQKDKTIAKRKTTHNDANT